jgi:hypothetical protein
VFKFIFGEYRHNPLGVVALVLLLVVGLAVDIVFVPESPSSSPTPGVPLVCKRHRLDRAGPYYWRLESFRIL